MDNKAAAVRLPAYNMGVSVNLDLFQHHVELHWEACNERILLCRVKNELFFSRSFLLGVIVVVMLNDNVLITALAALGTALGSVLRGLLESTHVNGLGRKDLSLFGDAHGWVEGCVVRMVVT